MRVRVADDLLQQLRQRSKADRKIIGGTINAVLAVFGKPHVHSGTGIRRLAKDVFECRVGLDERLAFVFVVIPPELVFFFLGNHDEIQKMVRSLD